MMAAADARRAAAICTRWDRSCSHLAMKGALPERFRTRGLSRSRDSAVAGPTVRAPRGGRFHFDGLLVGFVCASHKGPTQHRWDRIVADEDGPRAAIADAIVRHAAFQSSA